MCVGAEMGRHCFSFLCVALVVAASVPTRPAALGSAADKKRPTREIANIRVLPPAITAIEAAAFKSTDLPGVAEHLSLTVQGQLDRIFESKGFSVVHVFEEGDDHRARREQLLADFTENRGLSGPSSSRLRLSALTYSRALKEGESAELLVLVSGRAVLETRARSVLSAVGTVITRSVPSEPLTLSVALVDSNSGEIVFESSCGVTGDFLKHPEKISRQLRTALRPFFANHRAAPARP